MIMFTSNRKDAMYTQLGYAVLEVGGIQNFILRTGKLKEMLAGSALVESLSKDFLDDVCKDLNLDKIAASDAKEPQANEVLVLQANAGAMHLLLASPEAARSLVSTYSRKALKLFPGLPLYAAVETCSWDTDSMKGARERLASKIAFKRACQPTSTGMPVYPICRIAHLDGLPAVAEEGGEAISLPSMTKRQSKLIEAAKKRLQDIVQPLEEKNPGLTNELDWSKWDQDVANLAGSTGKIAYIHMDGNDLGKLFSSKLKAMQDLETTVKTAKMGKLSELVQITTQQAFSEAVFKIINFELLRVAPHHKKISIPIRPLVLGGDDVTAIVKADLALLFIHTFIRAFERISREQNEPLSIGAGMVVCPVGYPFLRAYDLCEELTKSAKQATAFIEKGRPSSLDYIVLTNDAEKSLSDLRRHIQMADGGESLTCKPLVLKDRVLRDYLKDGNDVLNKLPRGTVRTAMNECRKGKAASMKSWRQLLLNTQRRLGGRGNTALNLMSSERLTKIFSPDGFFQTREDGSRYTSLGDFLELTHLLPTSHVMEYLEHFEDKGESHE